MRPRFTALLVFFPSPPTSHLPPPSPISHLPSHVVASSTSPQQSMALESASAGLHLRQPLSSPLGCPLRFPRKNLLMRKRRRLKLLARFAPPPILSLPFDHLFHGLLSAFPSANSLDLIVPALGFASGAAFYFSALNRADARKELGEATGGMVEAGATVVGEWVLFSSPTPFNRSVLVRCPSVSFEDSGELLEGVNDGLVRKERPYVNMARGRILAGEGGEEAGDEVSYQRLCVATGDGGVISLDWPENLELGREQGLDTTVLLVPGTPEGSMAGNVKAFVREALRHGCFPIVMNPRGCAGSPLTTPRLFTAADSDDVSTAIQFINKLRPWATLMGIGWGYGACMLTKYLTDVGERTPLTAAVCFNNPFDLNEASQSLLHHNEMDKKLTGGLVDILRANKELFQGKNRGFNVAKALSADRVRDFEGALSMLSYGFKSIEDFYAKSSTRQLVHRVKIPLLFIQSDDSTVPLFSIPRSTITENPFTSLLLCSRSPSDIMTNERSTLNWCQNLAIEWLSAVEIALLKGRHPLLNDVDITITPTKSIPMLKGRLSDMDTGVRDKINSVCDSEMQNMSSRCFLKLPNSNATSSFLMDPISTLLEKDDCAYQGKANDGETCEVDIVKDAEGSQYSPVSNAGSRPEEGDSPLDGERSQVLATATVILNMLDVTMPGTLGDEQKKRVLTATEQGETLMKALHGVVPEDVRGKLMSAVSEIVQSQGNKINVRKLKKIGWIPNISSSRKSKIEDQSGDISTADGPYYNPSADNKKNSVNSQESIQGDSLSMHIGERNAQDSKESSGEKFSEASGHTESKLEFGGKQNQSGEPEMIRGSSETSEDNSNRRADDRPEDGHINLDASEPHLTEGKNVDTHANEKIVNPSINHEESHVSDTSSVDHGQFQKEANVVQENNNENVQNSKKIEEPSSNQSSGNPPSTSVSQALDALTGFDDSTQMAVNSVFGVIENMIDHLERETGRIDSGERNDGILDPDDTSKKSLAISDHKFSIESNTSNLDVDNIQSGTTQANFLEKVDTQENVMEKDERKLVHDLHSSDSVAFGRFPGSNVKLNNLNEVQRSIPLNLRMNPYWDFSYSYKGYLQKYTARISNIEPLDIQSTTDLFLDPEEGRWKMLDQMESSSSILDIEDHRATNRDQIIGSTLRETDIEEIIEPLYSIPEMELPDLGYGLRKKTPTNNKGQPDYERSGREELGLLVKDTALKALQVEVARRVGMTDLKEIESHIMHDLEQVADGVSYAIIRYGELSLGKMQSSSRKFGTIQGQKIIKTIKRVVHNTSHLGKILPVGVIVGSILASLRKYFHVTVLHDDRQESDTDWPINVQNKYAVEECDINIYHHSLGMKDHKVIVNSSNNEDPGTAETSYPCNDSTMVGAVTAALGASALLAHHERNKTHNSNDLTEVSTSQIKDDEGSLKLHDKHEQVVQEKTENNLVNTLAEKAMSVAGPVVPTKNGGEVDHERLVAALAELGQKGGMLRLIGKVALLWGGIRGAMSLTERLISFLHISELPLFQRILGFVCMVLVMWSPVVIPLLPTLVENWTLKSSRGIADYACVIGLYAAITILVMLWGRRIRGYENPLKQYGLDLASTSKVRLFLKGFIGGTLLVLYVHSVNALLGYASLVSPVLASSSNNTYVLLKTYGLMLVQTLKGVTTATFIAMVEELLFRSWLPEEIAVDLGYYQSIIISGILFSLLQRSFASIPAFLFLSLALFGAKQRGAGTLFLPIGIRSGIITTNFVVQTGGFLYYKSATPFWLASIHPSRPFDGIVGLGINILLAALLFPRRPTPEKGTRRSK